MGLTSQWETRISHTLPPSSPQPLLKFTGIQALRHQPLSSFPPLRSPEVPMPRWILHEILDFPSLWTILPFTHYSRPISPLCKHTRSSLITMSDTDLEGIIIEPSN